MPLSAISSRGSRGPPQSTSAGCWTHRKSQSSVDVQEADGDQGGISTFAVVSGIKRDVVLRVCLPFELHLADTLLSWVLSAAVACVVQIAEALEVAARSCQPILLQLIHHV